MKIAIAGAGIAGLASALALAKKNPLSSIDVFERQQTPATLGAGIQLGPNAFAALYEIDRDLAVPRMVAGEVEPHRRGIAGAAAGAAEPQVGVVPDVDLVAVRYDEGDVPLSVAAAGLILERLKFGGGHD